MIAGKVLIDGVHCGKHTHTIGAYGGRAPLRLSLDYTAMRPKAAEAFLERWAGRGHEGSVCA